MTDEEKYEFDVRGYLVCHEVLSVEEVERIRNLLVDVRAALGIGKFSFLGLDPYFIELMAHPDVLARLKVILGESLRFDHAFGIEMTKSFSVTEGLHGGPMEEERAFWYQWVPTRGMHNGLVKVIYALADVNSGDGGFICIPGSHKANLECCVGRNSHLVVNPSLKRGDALIFTEALVHGSRQWKADHSRQALIYSYAPGCLAWKNYETIKPYLAMAGTEIQRQLLRPPYVGDYDEHESKLTGAWPIARRSKISFNS
jgi:phytanoyl-CoA dioxygenase PhyH